MGHREALAIDDHVVDGHDVDVDKAVDVAAARVAVAGAAGEFALDGVDELEHAYGSLVTIDGEGTVHEAVAALETPGLALDHSRARHDEPHID